MNLFQLINNKNTQYFAVNINKGQVFWVGTSFHYPWKLTRYAGEDRSERSCSSATPGRPKGSGIPALLPDTPLHSSHSLLLSRPEPSQGLKDSTMSPAHSLFESPQFTLKLPASPLGVLDCFTITCGSWGTLQWGPTSLPGQLAVTSTYTLCFFQTVSPMHSQHHHCLLLWLYTGCL